MFDYNRKYLFTKVPSVKLNGNQRLIKNAEGTFEKENNFIYESLLQP